MRHASNRWALSWFLPALLVTTVGCAGGSITPPPPVPPPPPPPPPPAPISLRQSVGPAGGTVASADGRVSLTITAGALAQTVDIAIDEIVTPPTGAIAGAFFEFGPNGTQFSQPATLVIRYDPAKLPSGATESQLVLAKRRTDGSWELERGTLDTGTDRLTGQISGFSGHGAVVAPLLIAPPSVEAVYQPGRKIDLTTSGTVSGTILLEFAKHNALLPPGDAAFAQVFGALALGATVTYSLDATAGVYWFRARYRWTDGSNIWLGLPTDPPARVIVFGLPGLPDAATSLTAVPVGPGAIDVNFTFPSAGIDNAPAGYRLTRAVTGSPNPPVTIDLPLAVPLPYHDVGLLQDTDYTYAIMAYNEAGSGLPTFASARTPPLPAAACRAFTIAMTTPPTVVVRGTAFPGTGVIVTRLGFAGPITLTLAGPGLAALENIQITDPGAGNGGGLQFGVKSTAPLGPAALTLTATSGAEFCPLNFQFAISAFAP